MSLSASSSEMLCIWMSADGSDPKDSTAARGPLHCKIPIKPMSESGQEFACRQRYLRGRSPSESRLNRCSAANGEYGWQLRKCGYDAFEFHYVALVHRGQFNAECRCDGPDGAQLANSGGYRWFPIDRNPCHSLRDLAGQCGPPMGAAPSVDVLSCS